MDERAAAKQALRRFMEWWSEENWAAGWMADVEHYMKRDLRGEDRAAFEWLIGHAGGWWGSGEWPPPFIEGSFDQLRAAAPATAEPWR